MQKHKELFGPASVAKSALEGSNSGTLALEAEIKTQDAEK